MVAAYLADFLMRLIPLCGLWSVRGSRPIAVSRDAVERGVDGWLRLRCEILVKERV
jgi:hypothetical protein